MTQYRIPLNARQSSQLATLKAAVATAQQVYGAALDATMAASEPIGGTLTAIDHQADVLVISTAEPTEPGS